MYVKRLVLAILLLSSVCSTFASGYFEYSPLASKTYHLIFSLRFQEARSELVRLRLTEPDNLISHSLANYMECLSIFIGEEIETFQKLKENKDIRLAAIKQGDRHSPYYRYTQADIYLQWAITRAKFEDYFQAVLDIKRAYNLLVENQELFPNFMPNKKNLGLLHALIGTVPDQYRWGVRLLGMSGTIAQGRSEIEEVLHYSKNQEFIFREEVYVMYAYLLMHLENKKEEAWETVQQSNIDAEQNPLACFVMANIAMQSGRNDKAIAVLANKPLGREFFPFPYLHFMEGVARLNRLEEGADTYLHLFINQTSGSHYIKEAYQKLAWYEVVLGRSKNYLRYMQACKSQGTAVIDEDISALAEARLGIVPDVHLLKARLLFDGGYLDRAQDILAPHTNTYTTPERALEYLYRMGRIYHAKNNYSEALQYYDQTIKNGKNEGYYYAANAALMSGIICEHRADPEAAMKYYQLVLKMRPDQYRNSLHQKAKAGMNRITDQE